MISLTIDNLYKHRSKEEKQKEQEQSRIKNERQPENQDKLIIEQQQQKIEKEVQQNYFNQSRNRICSFSQLHGNDHNLPSNVEPFAYSHTDYQSRNVQQKETHRISSTPIFKPANNPLHQESQDIRNFQLHQKQGVVDLDLDQHSMESEIEGESNSFAQRRQEEQEIETLDRQRQKLSKAFKMKYDIHADKGLESGDAAKEKLIEMNQQDNLLKKRHYIAERNDKDISQIADEEDEKVDYSVSKAYEAFKKQKTDRIMKFQAQKQQQTITQMSYLSVPYVNSVQKVCEITNNNQMQQRQLSEQRGQQQSSLESLFQPQQLQSSVTQDISQPKQPVSTQLEQGTTKLTQPTMQQKDLISSNRSPSFDANKKSLFSVQFEDSSKKQFSSSAAEIPKSQVVHVAPLLRKSSHSENQIPEKKQQQKQPEQQMQQQLSAPPLIPTDTSSKQGLFGNLKGPTMIATNTQPSVIAPINENISNKQGLFGNLKAPISMAADPQSAVFAPVKNNKTVDIPQLDLTSSTHKNSFAEIQKQLKDKEETLTKLKLIEQQQQEQQKQQQQQQQQLFQQSPEIKKVVQVQTPLFQSQKDAAVSSFPLDNIKPEEKSSQPSIFSNNNGVISQNTNNPKPSIVPSRSVLFESPSIVSPTLISQENAISKPPGNSLFAGVTAEQSIGSLFPPTSSAQPDKEPSQDSALPEKSNELFEQQKQPEIAQKPIEFKINTLPPKNNSNFLQIQKVFENPSNVPSVQAEETSKAIETKGSAPLTGGLFDQVIKKEGDTQKLGLFQNVPKSNGLFSGQTQQQSILASSSSSQSLFQLNTPQPPQPEASKENDKIEKKQQTQSTSLFGNLPLNQGSSNLSSNLAQPKGSLFGSGNSGTGLFSSMQPNTTNTSQSIQSGGLFGQSTLNKSVDPSQINLGSTISQNQPPRLPSTGLFGQTAENTNSSTKGSLFSIPPSTQNGSLFPPTSLFKPDANKQPSGGLFRNLANSTNSSLFGSTPSQQN